jgi:pyrroline-5-carboxylate reductase
MGEAILKGALDSSFLDAAGVTFYEESISRRDYIKNNYGILPSENICSAVRSSRYILFAVKPQNIKKVVNDIAGCFSKDFNIIISIAAGISTAFYEKEFGKGTSVIRIMPNAPAMYKRGMSTVSRGKFSSNEHENFALNLMRRLGECIVIGEDLQDISTAINGSGPAYFFVFCSSLIEAAVKNGISRQLAGKLVTETMIGSGFMLKEEGFEIDRLIQKIASPGGTTESALKIFMNEGIGNIIEKAVGSALERSKELEKEV